ncbi:MAG TPA: hypothetical protein VK525_12790 [Candidatus Saccharimonadales bacterium]|nr:hypothetical protein [Candidatus Saccharimonadales bacterium]
MAASDTTQFRERIQFFNGERLFASDLQDLESFDREIRWLHNQSLHQPGVGSGYATIGNKGDRQVTISPGYALDSLGREIILTQTEVLPIPPVADNGAGDSVFYYLTVSYPNDADLKPSETRDGICLPQGVVRLREEPVFCWVLLSDTKTNRQPVDPNLKDLIRKQLYIVLAQIEVFNCQLRQPISMAQRRNARPAKQPRVACGAEVNPVWELHPFSTGAQTTQPSIAGLSLFPQWASAMIDTSSGGFQATPIYQARLAGPRVIQLPQGVLLVDAFVDISAPTPTGFTIEIYIFMSVPPQVAAELGTAQNPSVPKWQVVWMGVES